MGYRPRETERWLDIHDQVPFLHVYGIKKELKPITGKQEHGWYPAILNEQAWSIKDL